MQDLYSEISEARSSGRALILATVVEITGSAPRHLGAKMLIYADGSTSGTIGGGMLEKTVLAEAQKLFASPNAVLQRYNLDEELGMSCGGRVTVFLEPIVPAHPLYIFGAGHIGTVLTRLAIMLGFQVTVVDNRPEFADKSRLPEAHHVLCQEYLKALEQITFTKEHYIVIVTHGHEHDFEIVQACIKEPYRYLGMIGSRKKVHQTVKDLRNLGIPENDLARLHSPIGLDIGGETPEEIALSIAAELVAVRNGILTQGLVKK